MKRWFRRALRRCGIDVPFADVVCPQHMKSIRVHENTGIEVIDRRSLVFLDVPESDDLRDVVPGTTNGENAPYISPDAFELNRVTTRKGTQVCWMPREPIVQYALYTHQYGWISAGNPAEPVLCSEYQCETRTGMVDLEIVTPGRFETGVAFKRPRWPRLTTESAVVKYALKLLETEGERPAIADDGARLQWKLVGPKVGERYVYVAFQENGVALWRKRIEEKTLGARMRRLISRPLVSAQP